LSNNNIKTGLALSGGALRGIFHLGVLQALEELHIPIHSLSGTSSGAIVAVLYAHGYSPREILKIATTSSIYKMLRLRPWAGGLLSHSYLKSLLSEHLEITRLEDLPKPVYVTACNLRTGKVKIFSQGEIVPIVAASSAIPIMFNPVKVGEESYVDGGLSMNLPVSPLLNSCDRVIGVNLVPEFELPKGELTSFIKIVQRTFDVAVLNNIRPEISKADVVITLDDLYEVNRMSWARMPEVYEMGYRATMDSMEMKKWSNH